MNRSELWKVGRLGYLSLALLISVRVTAADLDSLLVQKQKEASSQGQSEEDAYVRQQRLRDNLSQAFAPVVKDVYLEMKNAGAEFGDAAALYERLKTNLSNRYSFDYLEKINGSELIKFLSQQSFVVTNWYDGAFTLEGTGRLFAVDQDYVWDSNPCAVIVSVDAYYPSSGFNEGGAYRREYRHSCDDILSGQNMGQLKENIKSGIIETME